MAHAKGIQPHIMDQHETLGEVVKNVIAVIIAALAGWFGSNLTKVSKKEFDKLVEKFAALESSAHIHSATSNTELTAIKVTLASMQRQMDESFRLIREDIHRGREDR